MQPTRRDFLRGVGALVVSFQSGSLLRSAAQQEHTPSAPGTIDETQLDSWIALAADGTVTAFTGKCDLGQGMLTAQSQLVAEELCVPLGRVRLIQCDTALTPDQGSTAGSQSTPTNFNDRNLALAAATAREALLALGSAHLHAPADQLQVDAGVITAPSGKKVSFAELVGGRHFHLPLDAHARRRPAAQWKVLGTSVPALDHPALMTGRFEYVQHVRVPGMLHARIVRAPHHGATLQSVDRSSVSELPGSVQVVVRQNLVGVVADTQFAAITAARRLQVTWKPGPPLPPQESFFHGLREQPSHDERVLDSGDVEARMTGANRIVKGSYRWPFQSHGSMGPSCAVADVQPDSATVWSPTQSVYPTRSCLALILKRPAERIRVIFTRGAGCYGLNGADAVTFEAAVLSEAVGRPVRLVYSRQDEMLSENYGNACLVEHRATLDGNGDITAWDRESWVSSLGNRPGESQPGNILPGALLGFSPEPLKAGGGSENPGKLRNGSNTVPGYMAGCGGGTCAGNGTVHSERVVTHTVAAPFFTGPLRSPLRIQNTFANECFVDELSHAANADPVAFRLRHLSEPRLIGVVRAVAEAAQWQPRKDRPKPTPGSHLVRGTGMACVAYEGSNGYAALVAEVEVDLHSGELRPRRYTVAIDAGPVSNPDGLRNQVEGGVLQGTSRSLVEEITWNEHGVTSTDWETYGSLRLDWAIPTIDTVILSPPGVEATGAGETAITVTPAALGNAFFDATGVRLREVPFTPTRVRAALAAAGARKEVQL